MGRSSNKSHQPNSHFCLSQITARTMPVLICRSSLFALLHLQTEIFIYLITLANSKIRGKKYNIGRNGNVTNKSYVYHFLWAAPGPVLYCCITNINGKWAVGFAKKATAINIIVTTINQWDCVNCTSHEYPFSQINHGRIADTRRNAWAGNQTNFYDYWEWKHCDFFLKILGL